MILVRACAVSLLCVAAPLASQPAVEVEAPPANCQSFRLWGNADSPARSPAAEGSADRTADPPAPEGVIGIGAVARSASGYIAFEGVFDEETGAEPLREWDATDIFVASPDGTLTRITTRGAGFLPAWSPAGGHLAFSDDDSLWLYELATGERRQLVDGGPAPDPEHEWDYESYVVATWSPDGARIAYFMTNGATAAVRVVQVADGRVVYGSRGETYGFAWVAGDRLRVYDDGRCTELFDEHTF